MREYVAFVKRIFTELVIAAVVGAAALYALGFGPAVTGWLWGCAGTVGYFTLLSLRVRRLPESTPETIARDMQGGMLARMSLAVAVALVATQIPGMNLVAVIAGLCVLKPVFYIDHILYGRG